jgi:hypothetical protein
MKNGWIGNEIKNFRCNACYNRLIRLSFKLIIQSKRRLLHVNKYEVAPVLVSWDSARRIILFDSLILQD